MSDTTAIQRRTLRLLFASQVAGGVGVAPPLCHRARCAAVDFALQADPAPLAVGPHDEEPEFDEKHFRRLAAFTMGLGWAS